MVDHTARKYLEHDWNRTSHMELSYLQASAQQLVLRPGGSRRPAHAPPNRTRLATEPCQLEGVGPEAGFLGSPDSQQLARPPGAQKLQAAPRLSLSSLRASARHAATPPAPALLSRMLRRGSQALRRFSTGRVSLPLASVSPLAGYQTLGLDRRAAGLGVGSDV